MSTVEEWLKSHDFEILITPLSKILNISANATIDELTILTSEDIQQFFDQLKQDFPDLEISLKQKIDFKKQIFKLSYQFQLQLQSLSPTSSYQTQNDPILHPQTQILLNGNFLLKTC